MIKRDYRIAINLSNAVSERGSGGSAHESPLMDCMLGLACGYAGDQISACRHAHWALATMASGATDKSPAEAFLRCHTRTILAEDLVSTDAMVRAEAGRSGWCTSEILRVKAERLIQSGGREAHLSAEVLLHRALETARRQDARSWELRTAMSLSRLWRDQGRAHEALALLGAVHSRFTEGFDTADLKAARELMEQLAA